MSSEVKRHIYKISPCPFRLRLTKEGKFLLCLRHLLLVDIGRLGIQCLLILHGIAAKPSSYNHLLSEGS